MATPIATTGRCAVLVCGLVLAVCLAHARHANASAMTDTLPSSGERPWDDAQDGAPSGRWPALDDAEGWDDDDVLFQSTPAFPEAEVAALQRYSSLRTGPRGPGPAVQAADDLITALLKTTRAALTSILAPAHAHHHLPVVIAATTNASGTAAPPSAAPVQLLAVDPAASNASANASSSTSSSANASASSSNASSVTAGGGASGGNATAGQGPGAALDAAPSDGSASNPAPLEPASPAAAVDGQILVTEAEIIPAMQQQQPSYRQIVIASLKMRPMLASDLAAAATGEDGTGDAAVWQEQLEDAMEAASALEANVSVSNIHTRMTCIMNLGLELGEPPIPSAAPAAASSVASSIKALASDESVLVGVSLIRLDAPAQPAPNGTNATAAGAGDGSMLALLTLYGLGSPANAVAAIGRMNASCPALFAQSGASLNDSACGQALLSGIARAVLDAADAAAGDNSSAPARSLLQERGAGPGRNASGGAGASAAGLPRWLDYIRVRQQPEVNIIISQAVGVTASQQAQSIASQLQALASSSALSQLLALSGLGAIAQAGKPQVVELWPADAASSLTAAVANMATAALQQRKAGAPAPPPPPPAAGSSALVLGISVAAAVSVTAVSAAAVAIVVVKARTRAARALAAADAASGPDQLPKSSRRRRGSKGLASKYLPSAQHLVLAAAPSTPPPPCVIVTAAASGSSLAAASPVKLPGLLAQAGSGAADTPGHAPGLARGDSVSSAVLHDLDEQEQQDEEEPQPSAAQPGGPAARAPVLQWPPAGDAAASPCSGQSPLLDSSTSLASSAHSGGSVKAAARQWERVAAVVAASASSGAGSCSSSPRPRVLPPMPGRAQQVRELQALSGSLSSSVQIASAVPLRLQGPRAAPADSAMQLAMSASGSERVFSCAQSASLPGELPTHRSGSSCSSGARQPQPAGGSCAALPLPPPALRLLNAAPSHNDRVPSAQQQQQQLCSSDRAADAGPEASTPGGCSSPAAHVALTVQQQQQQQRRPLLSPFLLATSIPGLE